MNERERVLERVLVPVEVEVTTMQQRERREQLAHPKPIEENSVIDWRSYGRHNIPNRWRV